MITISFMMGLIDMVVLRIYEGLPGKVLNDPKYNEDMLFDLMPQGISSESLSTTYSRCGNRHDARCLADIEDCISCGETGHKRRNYPNAKSNGREDAPKKTNIMHLNLEVTISVLQMWIPMCEIFLIDVYAFFDLNVILVMVLFHPYYAPM